MCVHVKKVERNRECECVCHSVCVCVCVCVCERERERKTGREINSRGRRWEITRVD